MRYFVFFLISAVSFSVFSYEKITYFESDVTVVQDGSLYVKETISVCSTGETIKRGIVREFPTKYRDYLGTHYNVDFRINKVLRDGVRENYKVIDEHNGAKIYIGDADIYLKPGYYTYTIEYTTNRQLGFFVNHDELYWNATGNGWRLPIENAKAIIRLPKEVEIMSVDAVTGYFGQQGTYYTARYNKNIATVVITRSLSPGEGLTVTVSWPKGFILYPTIMQKLGWFLKDNVAFILILLAVLLIILFAIYCDIVRQRINTAGVVIPQFYPPKDMMPSSVGYLDCLKFKNEFIAADIVHLAVRGFLEISSEKPFWGSRRYTLKEVKAADVQSLTNYEQQLLQMLFSKNSSLTIEQKNYKILQEVVKKAKIDSLAVTRHDIEAFQLLVRGFDISYVGHLIALFCIVLFGISIAVNGFCEYHLFLAIILIAATFFSLQRHKLYTSQGRKKQDHVDGFKLFLETTEVERMKLIGTPPTKTPELYEKYLPYAMVLGFEDRWTQQFAPLFDQLEAQGNPYRPRWYSGRPFSYHVFSSELRSSFRSSVNSAIAAPSTPPGRSSGRGGATYSGKGGGGGGGGGW